MAASGEHVADDRGVRRALGTLERLLTTGETIEAVAVQHRLFALTHPRRCIAATSGRLIALSRHLLGGYDSEDIRWQDLKETHIRAGIIAAQLTLVAQSSSDLNISSGVNRTLIVEGLCKEQAQAIYRICQLHDQEWREKRRVRELEELRARSGGVQIGSGPVLPAGSGAAAGSESEPARRLRQAREMLEAKLISDSEYESIKAKIISGI